MSEPTPGPWWFSEDFEQPFIAPNICRINESYPNHEANARLMAAAPELLETLRGLVSLLEGHQIHSDVPADRFHQMLNQACDAIAKAEGRE